MSLARGPEFGHGRAAEQALENIRLENVGGGVLREHGSELRIVIRAEEDQRRDESSRADAGHEIELRACPRLAPTDEQAGTERAVIGATGEGENVSLQRLAAGYFRAIFRLDQRQLRGYELAHIG